MIGGRMEASETAVESSEVAFIWVEDERHPLRTNSKALDAQEIGNEAQTCGLGRSASSFSLRKMSATTGISGF
jgi:hypothetical protein